MLSHKEYVHKAREYHGYTGLENTVSGNFEVHQCNGNATACDADETIGFASQSSTDESQSQGVVTCDDINFSFHLQHTGNHSDVNIGCDIASDARFAVKWQRGFVM